MINLFKIILICVSYSLFAAAAPFRIGHIPIILSEKPYFNIAFAQSEAACVHLFEGKYEEIKATIEHNIGARVIFSSTVEEDIPSTVLRPVFDQARIQGIIESLLGEELSEENQAFFDVFQCKHMHEGLLSYWPITVEEDPTLKDKTLDFPQVDMPTLLIFLKEYNPAQIKLLQKLEFFVHHFFLRIPAIT